MALRVHAPAAAVEQAAAAAARALTLAVAAAADDGAREDEAAAADATALAAVRTPCGLLEVLSMTQTLTRSASPPPGAHAALVGAMGACAADEGMRCG